MESAMRLVQLALWGGYWSRPRAFQDEPTG
jgi:hypothetical protein